MTFLIAGLSDAHPEPHAAVPPVSDAGLAEARTVGAPSLLAALKSATASEHRFLEQEIGLLHHPVRRARFVAVLRALHGFHAVVEPALTRALSAHRAWVETRARLAHLRRDLRSLGLDDAAIDALPVCAEAAALAPTPARALGCLYVLEGATLGGRIIARALSSAPWLPAGGLASFHPYGDATDAMWSDFRASAEAWCKPELHHEAVAAAAATFRLLRRWLPGPSAA